MFMVTNLHVVNSTNRKAIDDRCISVVINNRACFHTTELQLTDLSNTLSSNRVTP